MLKKCLGALVSKTFFLLIDDTNYYFTTVMEAVKILYLEIIILNSYHSPKVALKKL
jgi:hypothetical protein